jgi:hypothetical protein
MRDDGADAVIAEYLGRVRSHLPLRQGADIVRELESSIRDRVDDLATSERRAPDEAMLRKALSEMGEPEEVAGAYVRRRSLVPPEQFRGFVASTSVVFAVHLALVGIATTMGRALELGPVAFAPSDGTLVGTAAAVAHALLVDVGLMVLVFAATGGWRGRLSGASRTRRMDTSPRASLSRVALAALVAALLTAFRDRVFVVVTGNETHPLFTEWFASVVPLVVAVLAVSVVSDVLYLALGESRFTLAVDALHGLAALACMLFLLQGGEILALPPIAQFESVHGPVNEFLGQLGTLVVAFLALLFAVKTVRRLLRFAQI